MMILKTSNISNEAFGKMQTKCHLLTNELDEKVKSRQNMSLVLLIIGMFWFLLLILLFFYQRSRGITEAWLIPFLVFFLIYFPIRLRRTLFAKKEKPYTLKYFSKEYLVDEIDYNPKFVKSTIYVWDLNEGICIMFRKKRKNVGLFILKQEDSSEWVEKMKLEYSSKKPVKSIFQYLRYSYFEE